MLDMVEFVGSMEYNVPKHNIMTDFFNEQIALYQLIKLYKIGVQLSAHVNGASVIYTIRPNNNYSIEFIKNILKTHTISLYGHNYNIIEVEGGLENTLSLTLKEKLLSE